MAVRDDNNDHHSSGVLNGQGVGIALAAIFIGVALLVAYAASDGALFAQPSSPAETGQKQDAATPAPATSSEETVISRDAFDKEPTSVAAKPPSQPQQKTTNAATSDTEQELLAIKNFPWSSVSGEYVKDSQERFDNLKQHSEQNQPPSPALPSRTLANVDHKEKVIATDDDQTVFDQMEIPPITDEANDEPPHDQQNEKEHQNDADNGGTSSDNSSNEKGPPEGSNDNSDSGSTGDEQPAESGNEVPPSNSTDTSSSNSTQSSSAPESENKTSSSGIEIEVSLG